MIDYARSGSSIVVVLISMSIFLMLILATYKSTLFLTGFAAKRVEAEQRFRLTQAVLQVGLRVAAKQWDTIFAHPELGQINLDLPGYQGTITFGSQKEEILLAASLYKEEKIACSLSCRLAKTGDQKLQIRGFQRHAIPLY